MLEDLPSSLRRVLDIGRNTSRFVRFHNKRWRTSDQDGNFHLYGAFNNGNSKDISRQKISIFGLILTFNEAEGTLILSPEDYKASKKFFPTLEEQMTGIEFARLELQNEEPVKREALPAAGSVKPCKVYWSNTLRFDPTDTKGKCLHFTASAEGSIFLVLAALPKDDATWYYVEISSTRVAIYKGTTLKTKTTNMNARALGDGSLYQSYFVCVTETEKSTVIEYGKSLGTSDSGDVYLNLIDSQNHLNVRFYAFGNDEKAAKIMDAHVVSRSLTEADCKGDTVRDKDMDICVQKCHMHCDPLAGCKQIDSAKVPVGCYACRVAMDARTKTCIAKCPRYKTLTREKLCVPTFDVSLKASANFGPLEISDIPTFKEFTICMWLRFDGTWTKRNGNGFYLVRYFKDRDNQFEVQLLHPIDRPNKIELRLSVRLSGSLRVYLSGMENGKWHQLCMSWSGYEGVAVFYKNGQRLYPAEYPMGEIRGGGTLRLGGKYGVGQGAVTLHISQFNLWDKVLTEQEIAKNAAKCDSGEGNAKGWHEWYNIAKAKQGFLSEPSVCRPGR